MLQLIGRKISPAARCVATLALLALPVTGANALSLSDGNVSINGFATIGAVYNPSKDLEFVRDFSQPQGARDGYSLRPDSVVGLQLNAAFTPQWEGVVQVINRLGFRDNYRTQLSWGFIKYSPRPDVEVRAGRLGYDAYLQGDSRSVGYVFLPVRLPIEYFGTAELSHIDGADLVLKRPLGDGIGWIKLYAGQAEEEIAIGDDNNYDLDGSEVIGGSLNYELAAWRLRIGATQVQFNNELDSLRDLQQALISFGSPELAKDVGMKNSHIKNYNAGISYDGNSHGLTLLYNVRDTTSLAFANGRSIYALWYYRIGKFTPYLSIADTDSTSADDPRFPAGHPLRTPMLDTFKGSEFNQRTSSLGLRYELSTQTAVKLQLDHIEADDTQTSFYRQSRNDWDGESTLLSVALDFIF